MGVKELGHLVLYVRDLAKSVEFYRDVLGWAPLPLGATKSVPFKAAAFNSKNGRTHHELLLIEVGREAAPLPAGRRVGLYHFGVKVGDTDEELREMLARLTEAGATVYGGTDHGFTHSLYIADPDGNEIELYIDVQGVDWEDPAHWDNPVMRPLNL
jgi:catechol-2,3-dioxygenase